MEEVYKFLILWVWMKLMSNPKILTITLPKRSKYCVVQYLDENGRKKEKSAKTIDKEVAKRFAEKLIEDCRVNELVSLKLSRNQDILQNSEEQNRIYHSISDDEPVNTKLSLIDIYVWFCKSKERAKRTLYDYSLLQKKFAECNFQWIDFKEVHFIRFIKQLQAQYTVQNAVTVTFYNYCKTLRIFINFCKDKGILTEQTANRLKLKLPVYRGNKGTSRTIPVKLIIEIITYFIETDLETACFIYVLFLTTCRIDEILKLQKKNFMQSYNILEIRQIKTYNYKTIPECTNIFFDLLKELCKNKNDDDFLFSGNYRNYSTKWHKYMLERKLIDIKYGRRYCRYQMRCIRHTSASLILESFDKDSLRASLGHKTPTHDKAYADLADNTVKFTHHENSDTYAYCTIKGNSYKVLSALENSLHNIGIELLRYLKRN